MSLSIKEFSNIKGTKSTLSNKVTTLNPNAAEFVPSALRSTSGNARAPNSTRFDILGTSGKAVLDPTGSSNSNNSDDEVHQYWCRQLPDDITPDFKTMGENDLQESRDLLHAGLSIHDIAETSKFSSSAASQTMGTRHTRSLGSDELSLLENTRYSGSTFSGDHPSSIFMTSAANTWDEQFVNGDQHLIDGSKGLQYNGDSSASVLNDLGDDPALQDVVINPVEFLASQFPGFSAESLGEVYYANGCDLNLIIEMLTQLELQVDGGFTQTLNSKASASLTDAQNGFSKLNGDDIEQAPCSYRLPSIFRGATDFASAVRKVSPQSFSHWKYEKNGSADGRIGSSRTSLLLASSQDGYGKLAYGDKVQSARGARAAPVWLETGEAVANIYSDTREVARDLACLRNACFEQARQAYLIGNKALAKELSVKGQLYNIQMKAAHVKAREVIYRQRNPVLSEIQSYSRGQERLIDLHGLHISEALHVLKHELGTLRNAARSAGQHMHVMVCVGTGHHTKGSCTAVRLPLAVEQYLVDENLNYTQPQPGLLRVVIC